MYTWDRYAVEMTDAARRALVEDLVLVFRSLNPAFDAQRFMEACGL